MPGSQTWRPAEVQDLVLRVRAKRFPTLLPHPGGVRHVEFSVRESESGGWAEDYPEALALCLAVELRDQGARSSARRMPQRSFDRKMDRPTKTAGAVQCGRAFRARADSILPGSDRLSGEVTPVTGRALPSRCPLTNPSQISRMRKQSAAKNFIPCCGSGFCSSKEASPIYGEPGSIRILVPPDWPKSAYRYPAASAPCYLP